MTGFRIQHWWRDRRAAWASV